VYIIDEANRRGIYIAMLPCLGRWVSDNTKGVDDRVVTTANAQVYGEFGKRFGRKGIIWILGGDRTAAALRKSGAHWPAASRPA
jgi:hypothetical protein